MGFPDSSVGKESACNARDPGSTPGSRRTPGEGIGYPLQYSWASLVAQLVKDPPAVREAWVQSLGWEDPPEKGKATQSSILAWRISWSSKQFFFQILLSTLWIHFRYLSLQLSMQLSSLFCMTTEVHGQHVLLHISTVQQTLSLFITKHHELKSQLCHLLVEWSWTNYLTLCLISLACKIDEIVIPIANSVVIWIQLSNIYKEIKNNVQYISKGKKERYSHLNVEFQRIARRDKKAFLSDQCKEIEENECERLEISSRKVELLREHFMQRWAQ